MARRRRRSRKRRGPKGLTCIRYTRTRKGKRCKKYGKR